MSKVENKQTKNIQVTYACNTFDIILSKYNIEFKFQPSASIRQNLHF